MKILGISGSPRAAATEYALEIALSAAHAIPGVETEQINLRGKSLNYCLGCYRCQEANAPRCMVFDDDINLIYPKIVEADALLLASPVYNMGVSPLLQTLFQRLKPLGHYTKSGEFALKLAAGIAVGGNRNGGQESTLISLNNIILSLGMINLSCGVFAYNGAAIWSNDRKKKGVDDDHIGVTQLEMLGRRVAIVTKVIQTGAKSLTEIEPVQLLGFSNHASYIQRITSFLNRNDIEPTVLKDKRQDRS